MIKALYFKYEVITMSGYVVNTSNVLALQSRGLQHDRPLKSNGLGLSLLMRRIFLSSCPSVPSILYIDIKCSQ